MLFGAVGRHNAGTSQLFVNLIHLLAFALQVFQDLQEFVRTNHFVCQINLNEGTSSQILHGGEKARPNIKILNIDCLGRVKHISSISFKVQSPQNSFEQNRLKGIEFFFVVINILCKLNLNLVLLTIVLTVEK